MACDTREPPAGCPPRRPVVLYARPGEYADASATVSDLIRRTAAPSDFFLFTSGAPGEALRAAGSSGVEVVAGYSSAAHAFAGASGRFPGSGFFFVRAGVRLPEAWDLRLLWTAQRHDGAGLVSPLAVKGLPSGIDSFDTLDRLCYVHSSMEPRTAEPLWHCVYVTPAAARAACLSRPAASGGDAAFASFRRAFTAARFRSLLADHIAVGVAGLPDSLQARMHYKIAEAVARRPGRNAIPELDLRSSLVPRTLHVVHHWGGGTNRWVENFGSACPYGTNLVLKSLHTSETLASQLWLFRDIRDRHPIRRYILEPQINGTARQHESYSKALASILSEFGIENIVVSSLIGHSLDVLRAPLPALLVCHDYYPFCPALNITFGSLCRSCDPQRLAACTDHNPHHRFFRTAPAPYWLDLRSAFSQTMLDRGIPMIAPCESVAANYTRLQPELKPLFRVIPHAASRLPEAAVPVARGTASGRLKVLVLGSLALNKGRELVIELAPRLQSFADLFLVGVGPDGKRFGRQHRVTVIEHYDWRELPSIIAKIGPDLALLASVVPETFSYTLQELFDLKIPALATRLGSFEDRIEDGVTGFLCEPSAASILEQLRFLNENRDKLQNVRDALGRIAHRSIEEMVQDYRALLRPPPLSSRVYFCEDFRAQQARMGHCRVYWRSPGEHPIGPRSSSAYYRIGPEPQEVKLGLHPIPKVSSLLLDLGGGAGVLFLSGLKLCDAKGSEICRWDAAALGDSPSLGLNLVMIPDAAPALAVCSLSEDARLDLPLPVRVRNNPSCPGYLTFMVWRPTPEETFELLTAECRKKNHRRELDRLLHQMKWAGAAGAPQGGVPLSEFQDAQSRIRELESSLSWRITGPLRAFVGRVPALVRLVSRLTSAGR